MANYTATYTPLKEGPRPLKEGSPNNHIGMATLRIDDEFVVNRYRVCTHEDGSMFLLAFQYKQGGENGEWKDVAHPVNAETREKMMVAIQDAVKNYTPKA